MCKIHVENRAAKSCLVFKTEFTVIFKSTKAYQPYVLFCTFYCILSLHFLCAVLCPQWILPLILVLVSKNVAGSHQWPSFGLLVSHPSDRKALMCCCDGTRPDLRDTSVHYSYQVLAGFRTETGIIPQNVALGHTSPLF